MIHLNRMKKTYRFKNLPKDFTTDFLIITSKFSNLFKNFSSEELNEKEEEDFDTFFDTPLMLKFISKYRFTI